VVLALPAAVLSLAIGAVLFQALGVAHIEWNIALAISLPLAPAWPGDHQPPCATLAEAQG
jgi:hypothetical protein